MSHELPKAYDPSLIEEKWSKFWVDERIFSVPTPADASSIKPFVQLLPPPNVTGRLHIGHMLEHTQMDILTRWHRMSGDTAVWVPGTDHAGIATQMMVERQLAAEGATNRETLGREAFTERVWEWKQQYGSAITDQMRRLGASVDWSREYFTMDDRLSLAVREAFVRLWEQGLIYRGAYIVNWDPQIQTAVSDLEVDSEERIGKLYSIRYDLADGTGSITIATTRPETMLGDVAVAVNPTDDRYQHLIGKLLRLPLVGREIPILADTWAQPEFGTGAVKVTPAHDPNDFAIGQRHNLPNIVIFDSTAHIDLPGSPFHALDRFEARERIVAQLESIGALVEIKDHPMTVPISQRTGVIIEPRLSMQWFLAVNKQPQTPGAPSSPTVSSSAKVGSQDAGSSIAATAIAAVRDGHITFTPDNNRKTYMEWMTNIHDWCISRQLWWGHRIPAWHCAACNEIIVARNPPTTCTKCSSTNLTQETDVLDTWFSSGLLPFTVFGWPGDEGPGSRAQGPESHGTLNPNPYTLTPDLAAFYPTQQLVTGFDILFFWVARMIMLSCHFMLDVPASPSQQAQFTEEERRDVETRGGRPLRFAVPFRNVYIHALVRDADRQKISKTKGNVIDPIEIVTKYGTDAVRFTLAAQASPGTDIAFNEARTEGYRAFANKIWNAARFLFMQLERAKQAGISIDVQTLPDLLSHVTENSPYDERWIVAQLSATAFNVDNALKGYRFDLAASYIYQFFWGDFCDWYIEIIKLRVNFDEITDMNKATATAALITTMTVFENSLRLLSPFMPFLTEEIWQAFYEENPPAVSIALVSYPILGGNYLYQNAVWMMAVLKNFVTEVRGLRKALGIPDKEWVNIELYPNPEGGSSIWGELIHQPFLYKSLARIQDINYIQTPLSGANTRSNSSFDVAILYERQIDVPAERERLTKDLAKYTKGLEAADKQLSNEGFIARAPAHIVEGLKKQHAETQALKQKAEAALAALPPS